MSDWVANVAEHVRPLGRRDVADNIGMGHIVVVEHLVGLGLVDLDPGEQLVRGQDEIVGEVLTTRPLVQSEQHAAAGSPPS